MARGVQIKLLSKWRSFNTFKGKIFFYYDMNNEPTYTFIKNNHHNWEGHGHKFNTITSMIEWVEEQGKPK